MSELDTKHLNGMLAAISDMLTSQQDALNQLDAVLGDGDHGTGISKAFQGVAEAADDAQTPAEVMKAAAMTLMNRMGGSSGAIYGTLFLRASTAISEQTSLSPSDFMAMWKAGADGAQQRGKAQLGDKTMIDALLPAIAAMADKSDFGDLLSAASVAAREGADSTKDLVAKHGRAKFLGERAIGHLDAGAVSMALMFEAMNDYWRGLEHDES